MNIKATAAEIAHDEQVERNMENGDVCPLCGSANIEITFYDFGQEPMTGYHISGYRFECADCGKEGEYE